jgi:hypothetical protein
MLHAEEYAKHLLFLWHIQAVEQSLADMNTTSSLQALFKSCARGLSDLTALVCGKLTSLQRKVRDVA